MCDFRRISDFPIFTVLSAIFIVQQSFIYHFLAFFKGYLMSYNTTLGKKVLSQKKLKNLFFMNYFFKKSASFMFERLQSLEILSLDNKNGRER